MSENERDPDIASAWREASREAPPPALDDAVRVQARRAIGAAPEDRSRHRVWRYPAAAAATVAVLAFGIASMTSRDPIEPVMVADQSTRQPLAVAPAGTREPRAPEKQALDSGTPVDVARSPQTSADAKVASAPPAARAAREPSPPRTKNAPVRKNEAAPNERFVAPPPAAPMEEPDAPRTASNSAPPTRAQSATAREAVPDATPRDAYAQGPERQSPAGTLTEMRRAVAVPPPMALAKVTNLDEAKAKQAGAESVEAWITRIRDLKSRGESDAAAKELAKFRETYADRAEALLPEDLRAR